MLVSALLANAQQAPPRVFYSDLVAGPKTGGRAGNGVIVTIWGQGFGSTRGTSTVTIGGGNAAYYGPSDSWWSDTKISFELGPSAASGNIVVKTSAGTGNGIPFTIQNGNIFFVSASGSNSGPGSYSQPWGDLVYAKNTIAAGDTIYAMDGVMQKTEDNYNAGLAVTTGGSASGYKALIAYPGANVTLGRNDGARPNFALKPLSNYWVYSQLKLTGATAVDTAWSASNLRFVGNEMWCPGGSGQSACFHTDTASNVAFYGNYVHDVGNTAGSIDKYYHAVYFTTNSNHLDVGWNTIVPNPTRSTTSGGCRAIQFYSTGGSDQYDLHVHDNLIHDAICDGINFATVNPNNGTVEAYNNVFIASAPDRTPPMAVRITPVC